MKQISVNGKTYDVIKLLGHGKGGYSYHVTDGAKEYVLKVNQSNTSYRQKLVRESASMFMDIAAFYGLHAQGGGKVYTNASTEPLTKAANIYGLIEKYQTKNTTYLYIQSNRQRSYDFYGNYHLEDFHAKTSPRSILILEAK